MSRFILYMCITLTHGGLDKRYIFKQTWFGVILTWSRSLWVNLSFSQAESLKLFLYLLYLSFVQFYLKIIIKLFGYLQYMLMLEFFLEFLVHLTSVSAQFLVSIAAGRGGRGGLSRCGSSAWKTFKRVAALSRNLKMWEGWTWAENVPKKKKVKKMVALPSHFQCFCANSLRPCVLWGNKWEQKVRKFVLCSNPSWK